jgi:glucosyl-dolichyl phosphate glucuronosyltransferase
MTSAAPTVSVVVCATTQHRWQDLEGSVESARALSEATEIIVVIDHAPVLFQRARARWPELQVIENVEALGLSGARNSGIAAASGEVVAFLDEEATADADWLTWMLDSFSDVHVAGVGGHAEPVWPDSKTSALYPDELLWIVGCSYRGLPTQHADVRTVVGCTMAFRRSVLLAAGGFSTNVGRVGSVAVSADETELCIRIRQADPAARICYEPLSLVNHRVSADRGTWSHLGRRSFAEGISKAVLGRLLGRSESLFGEPSYVTGVLPKALVREFRLFGRGGVKRALALVVSVAATVLGYAVGSVAGVRGAQPSRPAAAPVLGPPRRPSARVQR